VTSTTVVDLTQTLSFLSDGKSILPLQVDKIPVYRSAAANPANDRSPLFSDTVSLSYHSRQAVAGEVTKELPSEVAKKEKAKKEAVNIRMNAEGFERALSKVQFVYDERGDLIVKYMDASDRLVYQIPSELMLYQKESALKAGSSVDASV